MFKEEIQFLEKSIDQFKFFDPLNDVIPKEVFETDKTVNQMKSIDFKVELPVVKSKINKKERVIFLGISDPKDVTLYETGILTYVMEVVTFHGKTSYQVIKAENFLSDLKKFYQIVKTIKNDLEIIKSFYEAGGMNTDYMHGFVVTGFLNINMQALMSGRNLVNDDFKIHGVIPPDIIDKLIMKLDLPVKPEIGAITLSSYTKKADGSFVYFANILNKDFKPITTGYLETKNFIDPNVQFILVGSKYDYVIKSAVDKIIDKLKEIVDNLNKLEDLFVKPEVEIVEEK